jgi:hypothetical protein
MLRELMGWAVLAVAVALAVRAMHLRDRAEAYRLGCLVRDGMPAWGEPVGSRFTPEGEALRRRSRRAGAWAALGAAAGLALLLL